MIVFGLTLIYVNLEPRYRLADQVPDKQQAVAASERLDAKLTGANPVDVLIEFPKGAALYAPETLATIADVHDGCGKTGGRRQCLVAGIAAAVARREGRQSDISTLKEYVELLPEHLTRRFIAAEQDAVVVSGRIPDIDASQLLPVIESARSGAERCPGQASRLQLIGDRPLGHRRAQQRRHDRQVESED